jgi:hypothetical protein
MSKSIQNKKSKKTQKTSKITQRKPIIVYDHAGLIPYMSSPEGRSYTVVQTIDTTYTLSQAALTESTLGFNFKLTDLAQYTTFQNLFDQYMIDEVQMILRPAGNYSAVIGINTEKIPLLYVVIDYDDSSTPSGVSQLKEYSNCSVSLFETVCVRFKPHVAMAAYSGSFTSFANVKSTWIDVAYPSVQHYGVKMACEAGLSGQSNLQYWDISIKYKISFRNVR